MSKDFMDNKKETVMKREYSDQEIKKILSEDIETPEYVNQRIKDTYECLGIHHNKNPQVNTILGKLQWQRLQ